MIPGLVQILLWQGLGELVSHFVLPIIKGSVNSSLALVSDAFSQHLGVLFVPAAVGVILFLPQLKANAMAIGLALVVSVVLTISVTALVLRFLAKKDSHES